MKKILVFFGILFISLAFNPAISTADEVYSSDSELPQFAVKLLEKKVYFYIKSIVLYESIFLISDISISDLVFYSTYQLQ